ncbi:MAG: hypothetical protein MKZ55_00505 [Candidatus Thalassarchaeum sp.]|nr:hypothetical protein [Candidatus Thalassarchaeum sp.]
MGLMWQAHWMYSLAVSVISLLLYIKSTVVNICVNHALQNLSANVYQRPFGINWIYPPMLEMNQGTLP